MATSNSTRKSACSPFKPAEITSRIYDTLRGLVIPRNSLCESGDAVSTLQNAHEIMELLEAIEATKHSQFEMPKRGEIAIANIRHMVQDAIKYSVDLCDGEQNLRSAFDCGKFERPAAGKVANG